MRDIFDQVEAWLAAGHRAALATVTGVERSAPRGPGAAMAVNDEGQVAGSVSGGCVESDLYEHLRAVLASGEPRAVEYGISDEQGFEVGLSCGGTLHLFVEPLDWPREVIEALGAAYRSGEGVALATVLDGPHSGAKLVVTGARLTGTTGDPSLDGAIAAAGRSAMDAGRSEVRQVAPAGGAGTPVFFSVSVPPARLFVFGAVDFARALTSAGKLLGYHVVACDARPVFATPERFPDADEVLCRWPHEVLREADLGPRDAVCVLTHDNKFDVPALQVALASRAGYIGALGSRRTQARRRQALIEAGVPAESIDRIAAPIGLDIGAETPAEFAVAVLAEIVATRTGRPAGRLADRRSAVAG